MFQINRLCTFHRSPNNTTTTPTSSGHDIQTLLPYIIGGVILIALVLVVVLIFIMCRRKRSRNRGELYRLPQPVNHCSNVAYCKNIHANINLQRFHWQLCCRRFFSLKNIDTKSRLNTQNENITLRMIS